MNLDRREHGEQGADPRQRDKQGRQFLFYRPLTHSLLSPTAALSSFESAPPQGQARLSSRVRYGLCDPEAERSFTSRSTTKSVASGEWPVAWPLACCLSNRYQGTSLSLRRKRSVLKTRVGGTCNHRGVGTVKRGSPALCTRSPSQRPPSSPPSSPCWVLPLRSPLIPEATLGGHRVRVTRKQTAGNPAAYPGRPEPSIPHRPGPTESARLPAGPRQGAPGTHVLAHVVLGAHQVLHVGPQLLVLPLELVLGLQGLLQGAGQGQRFGFLLSGLRFGSVSLLRVAGRDVLLFGQQLPGAASEHSKKPFQKPRRRPHPLRA